VNAEALDLWKRAQRSFQTARQIALEDPDSAASRAYYAAFSAVSALFALEGRAFSKHSALESAVHRDLVKSGIWPRELGSDFSWLIALRSTGDYGGKVHVSSDDVKLAVEKSGRILAAVREQAPAEFAPGACQ